MQKPVVIAATVYALAMISANLTVAAFGPWISPINSFFLIGLDLSLRDWLHVRLPRIAMVALILCTGVLTYALNPAAGMIATASSVAFTVAAFADYLTFARMRGTWLWRANGSNVVGAAVDSILFPTIAFGALLPHIVALQFVAKIVGGAAWAWSLSRYPHGPGKGKP